MKKALLFIAALVLSFSLLAQSNSKIDQLSFLVGSWEGEGFGGYVEEVWTQPKHNHILGMFRHIEGDSLNFMELFDVVQIEDDVVIRLKHFSKDFSGWEEKDEIVSFKLEETGDNWAKFDGLLYEKIAEDHLRITVNGTSNGEPWKEILDLHRTDKRAK